MMTLSKNDEFYKAFAERTYKLYSCYRNSNEINEQFEVTALINCAVGLFIVPKEKHYKKITDNMIEPQLLDELINICIKPGADTYGTKTKNLMSFINHIRNSISHGKFYFEGSKEIERIIFKDESDKGEKIKIVMTIEQLRQLFIQFCEAIINTSK